MHVRIELRLPSRVVKQGHEVLAQLTPSVKKGLPAPMRTLTWTSLAGWMSWAMRDLAPCGGGWWSRSWGVMIISPLGALRWAGTQGE